MEVSQSPSNFLCPIRLPPPATGAGLPPLQSQAGDPFEASSGLYPEGSPEPMFRERSGTWPCLVNPLSNSGNSTPTDPAEAGLKSSQKPKKRKRSAAELSLPATAPPQAPAASGGTSGGGGQKKTNPWGEASYAELIAQALMSSHGGKMKLNEIYQWFADNILHFRERSHPEQAAGWKVTAGGNGSSRPTISFAPSLSTRVAIG